MDQYDMAQRQLDTRAIEIATRAQQVAEGAASGCDKQFELLRGELRTQYEIMDKRFASITTAQWTAAFGAIGIMAGWIFYLIAQHRP